MTSTAHEEFTPAPVEVTQGDRELYIELMERAGKLRADLYAGDIRAGKWDHDDCMAIIARHRIAHSTPAGEVEPVAWMYTCGHIKHTMIKRADGSINGIPLGDWTETPLYAHPAPTSDLVEEVRRAMRTAEMSAGIMRDHKRTGGWEGAEKTANAFDRIARRLRAALAKHTRAQGEG